MLNIDQYIRKDLGLGVFLAWKTVVSLTLEDFLLFLIF